MLIYPHHNGQRVINLVEEQEYNKLEDENKQLKKALEAISTMPNYDQDNEHRMRNIATKALLD
jgi:hypothetical protein